MLLLWGYPLDRAALEPAARSRSDGLRRQQLEFPRREVATGPWHWQAPHAQWRSDLSRGAPRSVYVTDDGELLLLLRSAGRARQDRGARGRPARERSC